MEIPKFSPEEPKKKPLEGTREPSFSQKEQMEAGFDSTAALKMKKLY